MFFIKLNPYSIFDIATLLIFEVAQVFQNQRNCLWYLNKIRTYKPFWYFAISGNSFAAWFGHQFVLICVYTTLDSNLIFSPSGFYRIINGMISFLTFSKRNNSFRWTSPYFFLLPPNVATSFACQTDFLFLWHN